MKCLECPEKSCKISGKDCNGKKQDIVAAYKANGKDETYSHADRLVSNGRAGTLSKLEEIAEFCHLEGYTRIAIAYCYSMEGLAVKTMNYLEGQGFKVDSDRCTVNSLDQGFHAQGV